MKRGQVGKTVGLVMAVAVWFVGPLVRDARAQIEFEREPIRYLEQPTSDAITHLQRQLDEGELKLTYNERDGYLSALMHLLEVPRSSQMLVFSKTSFQLRRISPRRPRAVYFNDHTYIGWVQDGDVVELSTVDPQQGAIFYTLDQEETDRPKFVRDKGQCLTCHASSRTKGVPGHLVRSVYTDRSGQPQFGSGTFTTDHRSPFAKRWGGWYVTGKHGGMRHMGNVLSLDRHNPEKIDLESGANVLELSDHVDVSPYLQPTSDIVALMVLEHQTQMHNLITFASYEARSAAHQDKIMNEALGRPPEYQSESTQRRIAAAGEKLLEYMLFVDEFELESPVSGVSEFVTDFAARGIRDNQGRSLRDFDLQRRMFRNPCSYLIDSPAFDALPVTVRAYVVRRLNEVLTGQDVSETFAHLSTEDRQNILQILQETKPESFAL